MRVVIIVLMGLLLTGCLSFSWERELRFEPPEPEAIASLRAGKTNLTQSLEQLGAPLWVWEYPTVNGQGAALAYGWYQNLDRGFRVSAPINREVSPSFNYDQIDERMHGLVLFFDADWKLESWRTGLLQDLTAEVAKRRPVYIEDEEDGREKQDCGASAENQGCKALKSPGSTPPSSASGSTP